MPVSTTGARGRRSRSRTGPCAVSGRRAAAHTHLQRVWRDVLRRTRCAARSEARTQGASIAALSTRPRTPHRGGQRAAGGTRMFRRALQLRRQGSNLRLTVNSRASYRSTTPEQLGSLNAGAGFAAAGSPQLSEKNSAGSRQGSLAARTGPSAAMTPAGVEPAASRLRAGRSAS